MAGGARAVETAVPAALAAAGPRPRPALWRFARKKPLGAVGGVLVLVLALTALFADVLATHDPSRTSSVTLTAPGGEHWLGTDNLGRDLYSRVIHGSRISLAVGLTSTLLGGVLGGLLGLLSGYVGGRTDLLSQRQSSLRRRQACFGLATDHEGPCLRGVRDHQFAAWWLRLQQPQRFVEQRTLAVVVAPGPNDPAQPGQCFPLSEHIAPGFRTTRRDIAAR